MLYIKSLIVAAIGFSAIAFAAPTNLDGCAGTFPGDHRVCESGRHEEKAGAREENHGINQLEHGNLNGIGNVLGGLGKEGQGGIRKCEAGRC